MWDSHSDMSRVEGITYVSPTFIPSLSEGYFECRSLINGNFGIPIEAFLIVVQADCVAFSRLESWLNFGNLFLCSSTIIQILAQVKVLVSHSATGFP